MLVVLVNKVLKLLLRIAFEQLGYWGWDCDLVLSDIHLQVICSHDLCNSD